MALVSGSIVFKHDSSSDASYAQALLFSKLFSSLLTSLFHLSCTHARIYRAVLALKQCDSVCANRYNGSIWFKLMWKR